MSIYDDSLKCVCVCMICEAFTHAYSESVKEF